MKIVVIGTKCNSTEEANGTEIPENTKIFRLGITNQISY